ncbi:MAG: hypothetical protein HQK59_11480, partial [Deltaproteobacteria bacterium]|nr:hypothetical protein [Deltaproteobacteria bacterium]
MKVGVFQFNPVFGEVEHNIGLIEKGLAGCQADLIVLPELCATGYQFISTDEVAGLAEEIPGGPTTRAMINLATSLQCHLVFGLAERDGDRIYNSAAVVGPQGFVTKYRKVHLFNEEKIWFSPSDSGFRTFNLNGLTIGLMICFDWFFPESARTLALMGSHIICHPANLVLPFCPEGMKVRCLENKIFAITANRIGREERGGKAPFTYIGRSQVVSPSSEVLIRLAGDETAFAAVEIDPHLAENKSLNVHNHLFQDSRPACYRLTCLVPVVAFPVI